MKRFILQCVSVAVFAIFALHWLPAIVQAAETACIVKGQEKAVLALFAPYELKSKLGGGWKFDSVSIERDKIRAIVIKGDAKANLLILDSKAKDGEALGKNFKAVYDGDKAGFTALKKLAGKVATKASVFSTCTMETPESERSANKENKDAKAPGPDGVPSSAENKSPEKTE